MKPLKLVKPLLATRAHLTTLIEDFEVGVTGTHAEFLELGKQRDALTRAINATVSAAFKPGAQLEVAVAAVEAANADLAQTADTQAAVKAGIDIAGKVLGAVAKAVAFIL